jgi:hypothetical protein
MRMRVNLAACYRLIGRCHKDPIAVENLVRAGASPSIE